MSDEVGVANQKKNFKVLKPFNSGCGIKEGTCLLTEERSCLDILWYTLTQRKKEKQECQWKILVSWITSRARLSSCCLARSRKTRTCKPIMSFSKSVRISKYRSTSFIKGWSEVFSIQKNEMAKLSEPHDVLVYLIIKAPGSIGNIR